MSDTVSVTEQRTSTPLAMTWLVRRRCSDDSCCLRPSYLTRRQHTTVREPCMTHMGHTTKTPTSAVRTGKRAAINSTVAQQPLVSTADLPGPLVQP